MEFLNVNWQTTLWIGITWLPKISLTSDLKKCGCTANSRFTVSRHSNPRLNWSSGCTIIWCSHTTSWDPTRSSHTHTHEVSTVAYPLHRLSSSQVVMLLTSHSYLNPLFCASHWSAVPALPVSIWGFGMCRALLSVIQLIKFSDPGFSSYGD